MSDLKISTEQQDMLSKISVMADNLTGAFSLRVDGSSYAKGSSENVKITNFIIPQFVLEGKITMWLLFGTGKSVILHLALAI